MSIVINGINMPKSGAKNIILTSSGYAENADGIVIGEAFNVEDMYGRPISVNPTVNSSTKRILSIFGDDLINEGGNNMSACIIELKPCPFCGGNAEIQNKRYNHGMDGSYQNWIIKCKVCGARIEGAADDFYGREYFTSEDMAKKWNMRDNDD